MTTSLKELIAQREALEKQISELREQEMASAIAKVCALIEEFALTQEDIFTRTSSAKPRKASTSKVAPKYRDPVSGVTWSGRGVAPKWIAGRDKSEFLIP
jgi:DNA-binding protein H-NS